MIDAVIMESFSFQPGFEIKLQEKFNSVVNTKLGVNFNDADLYKLAKRFWSFYTIRKINCYFPDVLISNYKGA